MNFPNKRFNQKPCRACGEYFTPQAPCQFYCSDGCKLEGWWDAYFQRTYGITLGCYRSMWHAQGGLCAVCGGEGFVMNPKKHNLKLVVDHCHDSGAVRGLLCHNCNRALGLLQDNIDNVNRAAAYLRGRCNDHPERE